jgi:hypothetical protein
MYRRWSTLLLAHVLRGDAYSALGGGGAFYRVASQKETPWLSLVKDLMHEVQHLEKSFAVRSFFAFRTFSCERNRTLASRRISRASTSGNGQIGNMYVCMYALSSSQCPPLSCGGSPTSNNNSPSNTLGHSAPCSTIYRVHRHNYRSLLRGGGGRQYERSCKQPGPDVSFF